MHIEGNYLCEVAEMQALRVLATEDGDDEEDEEQEEERRHNDQEEEDEETVWASPQRQCPQGDKREW